jgi:multisubunit Na+/H+ antiporter MnhB subunit
MKEKINWVHILYIIGVVILIIGAIDPLEGSVVIASGSLLVALTTYLSHDRHWKIFLVSFIMIVLGVCFLFYFSSLGGFGGKSTLSWWWGTLILPYPIGWLIAVITLIVRVMKKPDKLKA